MFRGQFEHAMDQKGRVALPSRFRDAMLGVREKGDKAEPKVIITRALTATCLDVFPIAQWEAFEAKVAALPQFDPNVIKLQRLYISAAIECELDGQGRVNIPSNLRAFAKLEKEVIWAGMTGKAELWALDAWKRENDPGTIDTALLRALGTELKL